MAGGLDDVWSGRDFPVLREATRRIDSGEAPVRVSALAESTGLDEATVGLALDALGRRGLVRVKRNMGGVSSWFVVDVAGAAYLMTGLHPDGDDAVSRLVDALRQAADQEPDEQQRSRLRAVADGVLGVSRDVIANVMAAVITRGVGM